MILKGQADYFESGLTVSLRAMHLQNELMGISSENFVGFDKVGYQRKKPVVPAFSEYVGAHALSYAVDDTPGRIAMSQKPLDLALSNKGYFQVEGPSGIVLTRDGRFKVDNEGNLLSLKDEKVLGADGTPIVLPFAPEKLEDISVDLAGNIKLLDRNAKKLVSCGTLGVVTKEGVAVLDPGVRQGYTEDSNVDLYTETLEYLPIPKNFMANKSMFRQQNNMVSQAVQTLSGM